MTAAYACLFTTGLNQNKLSPLSGLTNAYTYNHSYPG